MGLSLLAVFGWLQVGTCTVDYVCAGYCVVCFWVGFIAFVVILICVCSWLDGFIVVAILGCWFVAVYSVCVEFCWGVSLLVVELLIVLLCRLLSPLL